MIRRRGALAILAVLASAPHGFGQPAGSAFTYQGRLTDNGTAVSGPYDLQCTLFTAAVGGSQVGAPILVGDVAVTNGLFTVSLDFGPGAFDGNARYLEIGVRPGASSGAYTVLSGRQELRPAPQTVFAQTTPWAGVSGKPAGFADNVDNDSGGDITGVTAGTGLTGGGTTGGVTLGVDFAQVASAAHGHFGASWSGTSGAALTLLNDGGLGLFVATSGGHGIHSQTSTPTGRAVEATASGTGASIGVHGSSTSTAGTGIQGEALATTGVAIGVRGTTTSSQGRGVVGLATWTGTGTAVGVYGETASRSTGAVAIRGVSPAADGFGTGVVGQTLSTNTQSYGVHGLAAAGIGVVGTSSGTGVAGFTTVNTGQVMGVHGQTRSSAGFAVFADWAPTAYAGGAAVYARTPTVNGRAGLLEGTVEVTGSLSKGSGSFKIDHPLDPENKYLYHSFVESPDMMNVYNGAVVTDADGHAWVDLPDWFEALNRDFRYQLTVVDPDDSPGFAQAKVVRRIDGNRFAIRTSTPRVEVSWQVTGIRHDRYAEKHRVPVEEEKPAIERGLYLHADAWGAPERSIARLSRPPDVALPEDPPR